MGEAGDLRHHRTHYDVIVMDGLFYWCICVIQPGYSNEDLISAKFGSFNDRPGRDLGIS